MQLEVRMTWLGMYLLILVAAPITSEGTVTRHSFLVVPPSGAPSLPQALTIRHPGWVLLATRGGSIEEPQSSSAGTESDDEEDSESQKGHTDEWSEEVDDDVDDDTTDTDDEDDDLDMFLDAQEFIEEKNVTEENILDENPVEQVVNEATATISDESIDEDYEDDDEDEDELEEDDKDNTQDFFERVMDENIVKEEVVEAVVESATRSDDLLEEEDEEIDVETSPETDFDKQITPQEDTPSTEDASQVEPEFSPGVETEDDIVDEQTVTETTTNIEFAESAMNEPSVETVEYGTDSMVDTETIEEEAAFVTESQVDNIPAEVVDFSQQHTTDDDSLAFVDRMELADDEGEAALTEMPEEEIIEARDHVVEKAAVVNEATPVVAAVVTDEEVIAGDGANDEKAVESSVAVVDDETKRILQKELKYHRQEVNGMKPEIALVLAEKRLRRPCEGIPPNWYTEEAKHQRDVGASRKKNLILKIMTAPVVYAVPIVLGGLAIYGSADIATMVSTISSGNGAACSRPSEEKDEENDKDESTQDSIQARTDTLRPPLTTGSGGIEPYDNSRIPKKKNEDTWLDKVLMGIAKPIKAFWDIRI